MNSLFYSNLKDKTPLLNKSNAVYKLKCECGLKYVGTMSQTVKQD